MTNNHIILFAYLSRWGDAPEVGPVNFYTALNAVDPTHNLMYKYYDRVGDADMEQKLQIFKKVFI